MFSVNEISSLPVHELFARRASMEPNNVAVIDGDERISFGELNRRASALAMELQQHGITVGAAVGIFIERSIGAIVAILAVMKAGAIYVPLDPQQPADRTNQLIDDASIDTVVIGEQAPPEGGFSRSPAIVRVEGPRRDGEPVERFLCCRPESLPAYILFTSGSTGKPKGVIGVHRSILNNLTWSAMEEDDICCLSASLSFGASISPLFQSLVAGRPLVIVKPEDARNAERFIDIIHETGVTRAVFVTTLLQQVLELGARAAGKLSRLRNVGVAGATLTMSLVREFWKLVPNASLHNGYSSTEIGTLATCWEVTLESVLRGKIAIGHPVSGTSIYIVDENLRILDRGEPGELCVSAPHLALGYLNDPGLTAERFIADPFSSTPGARMYRTGDLGILSDDGEFELLGRVDDQVKIRGYRVTLGEVEAALASHPSIRQAVVNSNTLAGEERLVAYLVLHAGHGPTEDEIRRHAAARLPSYMHPSAFVVLTELPLSSNGKPDRQSLRPETGHPLRSDQNEEPEDPMMRFLAGMWVDLLGHPGVGLDDHFLDLGGDSLFVVRLTARIEDELSLLIPIDTVFERPTVRELSAFISSITGNRSGTGA